MEELEEGKVDAVTMVDQSAAFGVCEHKIILKKLKLLSLLDVQWIASNLSGCSQELRHWAALSTPLPVTW